MNIDDPYPDRCMFCDGREATEHPVYDVVPCEHCCYEQHLDAVAGPHAPERVLLIGGIVVQFTGPEFMEMLTAGDSWEDTIVSALPENFEPPAGAWWWEGEVRWPYGDGLNHDGEQFEPDLVGRSRNATEAEVLSLIDAPLIRADDPSTGRPVLPPGFRWHPLCGKEILCPPRWRALGPVISGRRPVEAYAKEYPDTPERCADAAWRMWEHFSGLPRVVYERMREADAASDLLGVELEGMLARIGELESTAAALLNWHKMISGLDARMRPGIIPPPEESP